MIPAQPATPPQTGYKERQYLVVLLIALFYIVMIGRYRAYDLDSVWWLSFSHSYWVQHIETDTLMFSPFPHGMGGVIAFGKLPGIVQGTLLGIFGWSYAAAVSISIAFVVSGLLLFANACRRFGYSINFTACAVALVGLTEAFVSASQKSRGEFLAVFFLCLALWLGARRQILLCMFVAALAAEVEPAAAVVPVAILVMLLLQNRSRWRSVSFFLQLVLGTAAAAAVYLSLHPHIVTTLRTAPWNALKNGTYPGGFFTAYYFFNKRHLPEFAILLAAIIVCFVRDKRRLLTDWPALCSLTVILASAALRWGNVTYFAFISPFICLFILQALYVERYHRWIFAAILLLTLPQYIYRFYFWQSRNAGFSQSEERQVAQAIDRIAATAGKAPEQLNVIGNYNLWFAHPSNFVNLDTRPVTDTMLQHADVLLCFDRQVDPILPMDLSLEIPCSHLDRIRSTTVDRIALHGFEVQVRTPIHSSGP